MEPAGSARCGDRGGDGIPALRTNRTRLTLAVASSFIAAALALLPAALSAPAAAVALGGAGGGLLLVSLLDRRGRARLAAIGLLGAGQAVAWDGRPAVMLVAGIGLLWCSESAYLAGDARSLPPGSFPLILGRLRAAFAATTAALLLAAAVVAGSAIHETSPRFTALASVLAAGAATALLVGMARR